MTITEVTITKDDKSNYFNGWAKVIIDDELIIKGIKLFTKTNTDGQIERFIRFPESETKFQTKHNIVNVTKAETREYITREIFSAYDNAI